MSDLKQPTTLERLQHYRPEQFEAIGRRYIDELIHNAAIDLGKALKQLDAVRDLHAFEVPFAPTGAKAVWVSDLNAALQGDIETDLKSGDQRVQIEIPDEINGEKE